MTEISHNAGQFVCNGLYYEVLKFLHHHHSQGQGLFLHVPILTEQNQQAIEADFQVILQRILHQV